MQVMDLVEKLGKSKSGESQPEESNSSRSPRDGSKRKESADKTNTQESTFNGFQTDAGPSNLSVSGTVETPTSDQPSDDVGQPLNVNPAQQPENQMVIQKRFE